MGIRVPRITLTTDFGDDAAFGDLNLLSVGYGLHQAWIYAAMYASTSIFTAQTYVLSAYGVGLSLAFIVSIATFGLFLLLSAAANRRLTPFLKLHPRKMVGIGAALMCVGTALLLPLFPLETLSIAILEVISGILTGIGSSILTLFWGSAFARSDATSIMLNSAFAVSFAIGIYTLVLQQVPTPFNGILAALLPLLEWVILRVKTPGPSESAQLPSFNPLPSNGKYFALRFGTPVFILGTALGILRQTSISYTLITATISGSFVAFLASMCATVVILLTITGIERSHPRSSSESFVFSSLRFLIPAIGVAAFFLPFSFAGNSPLADIVLVVGYMCFEALMWIFLGEMSHRFRLTPVLVFGLGRGLLALGSLAGAAIPVLMRGAGNFQPFGDEWSIMLVLLALVISYATLPNEKEMLSIIAPCPLLISLAGGTRRQIPATPKAAGVLETTGSAQCAPEKADAAKASDEADEAHAQKDEEAPTELQAEPSDTRDGKDATGNREADSELAENAQQLEKPTDETPVEQVKNMAKEEDEAKPEEAQTQGTKGNEPSDNSRKTAMPTVHQDIFKKDTQNEEAPAEPRRYGRFRGQIEDIAHLYLLSKRETEILFHLAKGRNSAYIQEKLYISEGTAKTHIRHVYRKLDVHSQHELMRLVEDVIHQESD